MERAAQVGCMLATLVIETLSARREYELRRAPVHGPLRKAYGDDAATEVESYLGL